MSVTNQNPETDSLKIIQNPDGSYSAEWDRNDPEWSWLNNLTSKELQIIIEHASKAYDEEYGD